MASAYLNSGIIFLSVSGSTETNGRHQEETRRQEGNDLEFSHPGPLPAWLCVGDAELHHLPAHLLLPLQHSYGCDPNGNCSFSVPLSLGEETVLHYCYLGSHPMHRLFLLTLSIFVNILLMKHFSVISGGPSISSLDISQ